MRRIRPVGEDEMVTVFLQGELNSPRFGARLLEVLRRERLDAAIITSPNLQDEQENSCRRMLLGQLRGFAKDASLFRKFPGDVHWERAIVTAAELKRALYINYDYWVELSGGSRMPADAAKRIRAGVEVFRQRNDSFWNAASARRADVRFQEMIFVTHDRKRLVVLDGHVRLTSFMLEPDLLPSELEVLLGSSQKMVDWPLY